MIVVLAALFALSAQAREVVDFTNERVALPDRPLRIVTLAPSLGELVADLVGESMERIVGVTEFTDYPPSLAKKTSVGRYDRFNLEKVVALKPDLVLSTIDGNSKDQVAHLRELGVPVVVLGNATFEELEKAIRLAADATGNREAGERIVSRLRAGLTNFMERARSRSGAKPKVLLQVGDAPLVVAGGKSLLNEAIELVGGSNVYADAREHYPKPSLEDVARKRPDVIIVFALGQELKPFQAMAARWMALSDVPAVRSKRIVVVMGDPVLRPSLRMLEGLSLLEKAVFRDTGGEALHGAK